MTMFCQQKRNTYWFFACLWIVEIVVAQHDVFSKSKFPNAVYSRLVWWFDVLMHLFWLMQCDIIQKQVCGLISCGGNHPGFFRMKTLTLVDWLGLIASGKLKPYSLPQTPSKSTMFFFVSLPGKEQPHAPKFASNPSAKDAWTVHWNSLNSSQNGLNMGFQGNLLFLCFLGWKKGVHPTKNCLWYVINVWSPCVRFFSDWESGMKTFCACVWVLLQNSADVQHKLDKVPMIPSLPFRVANVCGFLLCLGKINVFFLLFFAKLQCVWPCFFNFSDFCPCLVNFSVFPCFPWVSLFFVVFSAKLSVLLFSGFFWQISIVFCLFGCISKFFAQWTDFPHVWPISRTFGQFPAGLAEFPARLVEFPTRLGEFPARSAISRTLWVTFQHIPCWFAKKLFWRRFPRWFARKVVLEAFCGFRGVFFQVWVVFVHSLLWFGFSALQWGFSCFCLYGIGSAVFGEIWLDCLILRDNCVVKCFFSWLWTKSLDSTDGGMVSLANFYWGHLTWVFAELVWCGKCSSGWISLIFAKFCFCWSPPDVGSLPEQIGVQCTMCQSNSESGAMKVWASAVRLSFSNISYRARHGQFFVHHSGSYPSQGWTCCNQDPHIPATKLMILPQIKFPTQRTWSPLPIITIWHESKQPHARCWKTTKQTLARCCWRMNTVGI